MKTEKTKIDPKDKRLTLEYLPKNSKKGLSILAGINRPIIPGHVSKISKSIEEMGVIRPVTVALISFITGIPIFYIIDGQHLYHACLRLNIEVPYTVIDIKDDLDMIEKLALLNTSSKSWTMRDYLLVWSYKIEDYIKLNKYYNTYDIELVQLSEILMEGTAKASTTLGGNNFSKHIKNGTFKIGDEEKAVFLLNCVTDALKIIPRMYRAANKMFIGTYISFINNTKDYDHKQFLINLKKDKNKFVLATQDPEEFKKLLKTLL